MKRNSGLTWLILALACIAIGWFGHQYLPDVLKLFNDAGKSPAAVTEPLKKADEGEFCAKVITPARNPENGDIQEFPTTCSVPEGWELIENDIPELDLEVQ